MTRGRFKIIDRYIFGELMSPFFLGLATITMVLFIQKIFRLAELVISKGVSLAATMKLFFLILPGFLVVTIPMSTLLASIIAFSRLSSDSEITAMKSSCVSLYRMLKPVALLAVVTCIVTTVISLFVLPGANRALKQHMFNMVKSSAMVAIEAGSFTNKFNNLIIYVDKMKSADELEGIFLSDERSSKDSFVITARRGRLIADQQSLDVVLAMEEGTIHTSLREDQPYQQMTFTSGNLYMDINNIFLPTDQLTSGNKHIGTLALLREIERARQRGSATASMESELHMRLSIPFACLVFGLAGAPLGIHRARTGRSAGLAIAIGIFLGYYLVLGSSRNIAEAGTVAPVLAYWLPNLLIAIAAFIFIFLKATEARPVLLDRFRSWYYRQRQLLR